MYLIGLDFGTTNLKGMLYDSEGKILRFRSHPTPTHYSPSGQADYHPDEIVDAVLSLIGDLVGDFSGRRDVKALSFASMAETGVAVNKKGTPLAPAIPWFDRRALDMADTISTKIDPFELFKLTGVQPSHVPSLCKILWEKKRLPEVHRNTHRWMFLCNYIAYRMTGECMTDPSQACRSMVYDIRKGEWSKDICALFDIDPMIFPPVKDTGTVIGTLLNEVAQRTGLKPDLKVVLGGHDHLCGSLATGLTTIGTATNSSGTVDNATTLIDPAAIGRGLFDMGVSSGNFLLPDTTYAMGSVQGAGRTIEWFIERFYPEIGGNTEKGYGNMMSEADKVPPGSDGIIFMPHLRGSIVPHKSPTARGAFLGLKDTHTRGALARAVFEGLAMEFRLMIDGIENSVGNDINDIRCFGGGSRNATWLRIKADVLDRALTVYESRENTCLGAALLAGIGSGCYRHLDDAIDRVRHRTVTVKPRKDAAKRYEAWFGEVYRSVFETVDTVNRKISDHLKRSGG